MSDLSDSQLLNDYVQRQSEPAFTLLVQRHVDLVYSAALRMVGDAHAARDISQCVFVALAQNAPTLTRLSLPGWLHGTTRNIAAKFVRSEVRRRDREQKAAIMNELLVTEPDANWEQIGTQLDEAIGELEAADRDALLLRYFKNQDLRSVGAALGISDDAAQKRVSRAVEHLRDLLAKRGLKIAASGLVLCISTKAIQAAPVGLAFEIAKAAYVLGASATVAAGTGLTSATFLKNLAMAKLKIAGLGILVAAGLATFSFQQRSLNLLSQENAALRQKNEELDRLRLDYERLKKAQVDPQEILRLQNDQKELLKLRGQVGMMRDQLAKFQSPSNAVPGGSIPPFSAFQATANVTVNPGDTLIAGQWAISGERTIMFVTPELDADNPEGVRVRACFVHAPVELLNSLQTAAPGSANQNGTAQEPLTVTQQISAIQDGSGQMPLTASQFQELKRRIEQSAGANVLSLPTVITKNGRQVHVSATDMVTFPGFSESIPIGPSLDAIPLVAADRGSIQLKTIATYTVRNDLKN